MRCITIQDKEVYNTLIKNGIYKASTDNITSNLKKAYEFMMKEFNWKSSPIFLAPEGYYVEFSGAKFTENSIAIELDIPDDLIKLQQYYEWSDLVYFFECPNEFSEVFGQNVTIHDWGKQILKNKIRKTKNKILQVTVEYLKAEWIINTSEYLDSLEYLHNETGGANKLNILEEYKMCN